MLAAELALNNEVNLYTNFKMNNREIEVYNQENKKLYSSKINLATNDMEKAIGNAEVIFCTVPSNVVPSIIGDIGKHIKENAYLIFMPGTGGKEYISKAKITKNITIAGLQRVYSIARLKEKGRSVYMLGKKDRLFASAIPNNKSKDVSIILEKLFNIPCVCVNNYLAVTLTPSNPILHTSRLYAMFKKQEEYEKEILFYEEWDEESAKILFKCDDELRKICNKLNKLNLEEVTSLKEYYESKTEEEFANKLKSIKSFKGIKAPMIKSNGKYIPDYKSRYFTEDFPYGLLIIKGFATICNIDTPMIDNIIKWVQAKLNKQYIINNKLEGKDIHETGVPQNYGINKIEDVYNFYI